MEVLGCDATDSQAKVGCVIAVRVSYMFTTFYLMSDFVNHPSNSPMPMKKMCLTPLDVP